MYIDFWLFRPEWEKCADVIQGGIVRWKEIAEGKTSHDLMEVLLGEISGGSTGDSGGAEYFDGQGTGETVPKYLQYDGKVRNRRLGKRDTALLVKDIWREKVASDAEVSEVNYISNINICIIITCTIYWFSEYH